ncbi:hypothetical protein [Candidatus Uabimicrobium sp. HlEnr_7]|uniref:hypothetical protein n=1 Tax=Candidatus Uabimicrobium helgolandensis TaxID=3095367 RepID=UPI003557E709
MNPEFLKMQLFGAIIPATICAVVVLICARPWRENIHSLQKNAYWSIALGLAGGYAFAYWAIVGDIPSFPVNLEDYESDSWLIYISFILALPAFTHNFVNNNTSKFTFIAISALVTGWLIVPEWIVDEGESSALLWYWRIGYAATAIALFAILESLTKVVKGKTFSLICFFLAVACSVVLVLSANAKMAQLCGAISAMSMAMFVVGIVFREISWSSSGVYFLAILLPGLLVNGYLAADTPLTPFTLVIFAPIFAWGAQLKAIQKYPPLVISLVSIFFVFIPISIALLIAYQYYV